MASKDFAFRYYDALHRASLFGHNHKELSAWGGVVLELGFCAVALQLARANEVSAVTMALATICVVIVTVLVWRYILNQLEQKDMHSAYYAAASLILAEIASAEGESIDDKYLEIKATKDTEFQSNVSLPHYFQRKKQYMNFWGKGRAITRQMVFGLVLASSIGTITLIWTRLI